jgi:hypothetical protein
MSTVPAPRELRSLVPAEIAVVLAIAVLPLGAWPAALPLVTAATISRWVRHRSWAEVVTGGANRVWIGALAGAVALVAAVVAGTPIVEAVSMRAVEWSSFPIVRGSASQAIVVIVLVSITSLAMELALRGWLVERVLELSPGGAVLPVLCGALAEALVTPGDVAARIGAGLFGIGLGAMYVAGGRSVVAPVFARITFQVCAVVLELLRLVG